MERSRRSAEQVQRLLVGVRACRPGRVGVGVGIDPRPPHADVEVRGLVVLPPPHGDPKPLRLRGHVDEVLAVADAGYDRERRRVPSRSPYVQLSGLGATGLDVIGRCGALRMVTLVERRRRHAEVGPPEPVRIGAGELHGLQRVEPAGALLLGLPAGQLRDVGRALEDVRDLPRRRRVAVVRLAISLDDQGDRSRHVRSRHRRAVERVVAVLAQCGRRRDQDVLAAVRVRRIGLDRVDVRAGRGERRAVEAELERLAETAVVVVGRNVELVDHSVAVRVPGLARPAAGGEHHDRVRLRRTRPRRRRTGSRTGARACCAPSPSCRLRTRSGCPR